MMIIKALGLSVLLGALTGCIIVGPDYHPPKLDVPKHWQGGTVAQQQPVTDNWWERFHDTNLNHLIADVIKQNIELKQALVRINEARAQRLVVYAAGLPSASVKSSASQRLNNSVSSAQSVGGFGVGDQLISIFQSGFDAQWEIDLFGGAQRTAENADALVEAEIESSRGVLITLQAEVVRNYTELQANRALMHVAQQQREIQQQRSELIRVRENSGLGSTFDVAESDAFVAESDAKITQISRDIDITKHALSLLLGVTASELPSYVDNSTALALINDTTIPSLPSDLLKRRPDIRRAERQLAASNASIGIAIAELYPKLNLTAFLGLQNMRITDVTPLGKSWSTAASLSMPLFNWGKIHANIKSKEVQFDRALLAYQQVILVAFKEVEDALVTLSEETTRHDALIRVVQTRQLAVSLADARYQAGVMSYLDRLQNKHNALQAQAEEIRSQLILSTQHIALFKALGGGWQTTPEVNGACLACKKTLAEQARKLLTR
ncbi:MAG: efflux transporter outer membrane subunit [Methylovulum sp.]